MQGFGQYHHNHGAFNGIWGYGQWVDDKVHGHAIIYLADGTKHEGMYIANEKHGYGVETFTNGT